MSYAGSHLEAFLQLVEQRSSVPQLVGTEADAANAEPTRVVWVPRERVTESPRVHPADGRACAQRRVKFDVFMRAASFAELEEIEDAVIRALDADGPHTIRWGNPGQYASTEGAFTLRSEVEVSFIVYAERHRTGRPTTATTSTSVSDPRGENHEPAEGASP